MLLSLVSMCLFQSLQLGHFRAFRKWPRCSDLVCSNDESMLRVLQVVWTDAWSTLLTLDDRRIIDDPRISIERPYTRDWNLHIRKVTYADRGKYTCQINTSPVKTKTVSLMVKGGLFNSLV